jgi:NADH dehydrogenase [ubiquinone] 1 alpha subcomplex assembly factor 7
LPADAPLLIVANEFLDALPVHQLVKTAAGWRERLVGMHEGRLAPVVGARPWMRRWRWVAPSPPRLPR